MQVRNISNQTVVLRLYGPSGEIVETQRVPPGDSELHELWGNAVEAHALLQRGPFDGPAEPKKRGLVEPPREGQRFGADGKPLPSTGDDEPDERRDDKGPGRVKRQG